MEYPILYSFRRCPYAMRARMALAYANITVELREIQLRNKPESMLAYSPKGTVPVLVLPKGAVLDESLDVMLWALSEDDPAGWWPNIPEEQAAILALIDETEKRFKPALDRYKYPNRYEDVDADEQWATILSFFSKLEARLQKNTFLFSDCVSLADIAIFPFIRQCVRVNEEQFSALPYPHLLAWLKKQVTSPLFGAVMQKYPIWEPQSAPSFFPGVL